MSKLGENVRFYLAAVLYLIFNLRLGPGIVDTLRLTGWQLLQTAPYVAGCTYLVIAVLQYAAGGAKLPWDRRLRIFFTIGILAGLIYAIYEYTGKGVVH